MVQVVAHHGSRLVQQLGDLAFALTLEDLCQEVGVVSPASFYELLLYGGALKARQYMSGSLDGEIMAYLMLFVACHVGPLAQTIVVLVDVGGAARR